MASAVSYPTGPATCPTRCYLPPSDGAVVPIKEETYGFRRLLYDRQRAFMVLELWNLHEGMNGSDALIQRCTAITPPPGVQVKLFNSEVKLEDAIPDEMVMALLIESLKSYVSAAAWGDAAQRWAGRLPQVQTFAPGEILLPCACEGKVFTQRSVIGALKGAHKPDWSAYLDWAESMRDAGKATHEPRALLRKRLQISLERIHDDFLRTMDKHLDRFGFPMQDSHMLSEETEVRKLIDAIEPLPVELRAGLDQMDPFNYSMEQLEALRASGKAAQEAVAKMRREEGNALWARSDALAGGAREKALAQAEAKWMSTMPSGGYESIASSANLAALKLQQKNYEAAIMYASNVPTRFGDMFQEPQDYATYRWRSIQSFLARELVKVPHDKLRRVSTAEEKAMYQLMWKSLCREGKAHMALCQAAMMGSGKMSVINAEKAKMHRGKAVECYKKMQSIPSTPTTPMEEIEALEKAFNTRMNIHDRARGGRR